MPLPMTIRYQNNLKILMFVLFLITYTIVVNDRPEKGETDPTFAEWVMYTFVFGYIFEEFRLVRFFMIFDGHVAFLD
jgi:hypothetical protein